MYSKDFFQSKTTYGAILMLIAPGLDALGVKVDLCTERELHPTLKDRILADSRPV